MSLEAASTKSGGRLSVKAIHLGDDGKVTLDDATTLAFGAHLTTIWPGHPGKARWAATAESGRAVGIFEGTKLVQTLSPPGFAAFGRALR